MFFPLAFLFAATNLVSFQSLEDKELALAENTAIYEEDEATEDGELIFDDKDSDSVADLEDDN